MSELRRRLVHAAGTGVPALYLLDDRLGLGLVAWRHVQAFLLAAVLVALVLEALRLGGTVEWAIFEQLTREYEQDYPAGYAIYVVGMAVAALAYRPTVALPAMLMLTVGDPISGLLSSGSLGKAPWVLAAMFGVCLLLAAPFVSPAVAVAGALTATVADGVKPVVRGYVVDDNLTIPVAAGAVMAVLLDAGVPGLPV